MRDTLILLNPDFADPAFPGRRFYCRHCVLLEGLLASFPHLAGRVDVLRVAWERPRSAVVALLGEDNQSLPALILAEDGADYAGARCHHERWFLNDFEEIMRALSVRHGFPDPHP
jgi:hypothetical protein